MSSPSESELRSYEWTRAAMKMPNAQCGGCQELLKRLAARDAELAEARAEIERLRKLQKRLVADFVREVRAKVDAWSRLASEHFDCAAPAPPEREERPARPVMLLDANFGRSSAEEHTDGPLTQNP